MDHPPKFPQGFLTKKSNTTLIPGGRYVLFEWPFKAKFHYLVSNRKNVV